MKALTYTLKNIGILVVGIALALIFAWIVYDARDLSASVLSLQERAFIEKAQRDVAYKKEQGNLEVFISPQLQNYSQLFVSLLFSPSEIILVSTGITSPYSFRVLEQSAGSLLLEVSDFSAGEVDEGIVIVPFTGNKEEITVEYVSDAVENGLPFAMGNLNEYVEENHL
jgi:hypothetical protein